MSRHTDPSNDPLLNSLNQLIRDNGGDPDSLDGKLVREIMHTATKLIKDPADTGELKLISRSLKELRYAMKIFRDYRTFRKVSIFGSARTPEDHPDYKAAEAFGKAMAEQGWMVITGAGGGIMEAGHGGAGREKSFGVSIRLPFETNSNKFIEGDKKLIVFRYFFTRKLMFASQSHGVALFPGGFGTQDEGFEILTLVQTGKAQIVPIVMVDAPGGDYWKNWDKFVRNDLLAKKWISPEDLNLYMVTDNPQAAVEYIRQFYRNYHSQRYVLDELVIRMNRPLDEKAVDDLNAEFKDIVAEGVIEATDALPQETEHLELPRLKLTFNRRNYGRMRMLIDRINQF